MIVEVQGLVAKQTRAGMCWEGASTPNLLIKSIRPRNCLFVTKHPAFQVTTNRFLITNDCLSDWSRPGRRR